jgi:hypothetical protein
MKYICKIVSVLIICGLASELIYGDTTGSYNVYHGMSDASAAVSFGKNLFAVADDENNVLRVYKIDHTSRPVYSFDLTSLISPAPDYPEADIEGAAMVGNRAYWITSHGRSRSGQMRESRYRFFATSVNVSNDGITIAPVGIPCSSLIHEMIKSQTTRFLPLKTITRLDVEKLKKKERKKLAPKKEGLNIEALCAAPDGKTLYIGFRNPLFSNSSASEKMAIIVPLNNPRQVIEKGLLPTFGSPILLSLDGLGIRSMEYSHFHKSYFIIAGPQNERSDFALYRWSGKREEQPKRLNKFSTEYNFTTE